MKDRYTLFLAFLSVLYFSLYFYLIDNINFWISDLYHCFKVMNFESFLINHINIFFFVFLFFLISFYLMKDIYFLIKEIYRIYLLNQFINSFKIKSLKNIVIIDYKENLAFNFLGKVVLSKVVFKNLTKKERKALFLHEKGHIESKDSFKLVFVNFILNLFPDFIKKYIKKSYILFLEIKADRYALNFINPKFLANTLLKFKTLSSYSQPMMNNFTEERIKNLFKEENIKLPKVIHLIVLFILISLFIAIVYKTCFCGIMT